MPDHNHAYLDALVDKRKLATRWEATFNEWAEFADQMTTAYPLWIELFNAAQDSIAFSGRSVDARLVAAVRALENFDRYVEAETEDV